MGFLNANVFQAVNLTTDMQSCSHCQIEQRQKQIKITSTSLVFLLQKASTEFRVGFDVGDDVT